MISPEFHHPEFEIGKLCNRILLCTGHSVKRREQIEILYVISLFFSDVDQRRPIFS